MAATRLTERPTVVRTVGVAFLALMILFVWMTYAVFDKRFVDVEMVTITAQRTGLALPNNADVKIRGMRVGEIREIDPDEDGVTITAAIEPDKIGDIPSNVSALLVPKTLFGEKFVDLQVPADASGRSLRAGDTITQATVPIELETVLNELYPLLETVSPEELSYTLNALATALDGRGQAVGDNLVRLGDYTRRFEPLTPTFVDDLDKLGQVSDQYADVLPDLGDVLRNAVVTGNTVVAKRAQLQAFFAEGTRLSDTTTAFLDDNGETIIGLAEESLPALRVLAEYSPVFPCLTKGLDDLDDRLDSVFRDGRLNINLEPISPQQQPPGFAPDERPKLPTTQEIEQNRTFMGPNCQTLPNIPYSQANPAPVPPLEVFRTIGVKDGHNGKFDRAAPGAAVGDPLAGMMNPSAGATPSEQQMMKAILAPVMGTDAADVPDAATLFAAPFLRGAGVSLDAAP